MDRVREIAGGEHTVLLIDLAGLRALPELEAVGAVASAEIRRLNGDRRLRVLIDMTGVPFTLRTFRRLSEIAAGNAPYVRARAIVGLGPGYREQLEAFSEFSDRDVAAFDTRESALAWLAQHP